MTTREQRQQQPGETHEEWIARRVKEFGPLTGEKRAEVAEILRPSAEMAEVEKQAGAA